MACLLLNFVIIGHSSVRDSLKKLTEKDYWVSRLSEDDFGDTIQIVTTFIQNNQKDLQVEIEKAKIDYPEEDIWCEIQSDLAHYAWVDEQHLWQFCLLRLQGIFESLIVYSFLPELPGKKLIGMKAKLRAAKEVGFQLEPEEYEELLLWAKLRNAIAHAPPEKYQPLIITREDINEYVSLLKSICERWREFKADTK